VYKCLPNKELRSANSLDVSQDVIKNQHKNKAKTKPKQTQTKPICEMAKMNVSLTKTDDYGKNPAFCRKRNKAKQSQSGFAFGFAGTGPASSSPLCRDKF